jgi:hypothetical protein
LAKTKAYKIKVVGADKA